MIELPKEKKWSGDGFAGDPVTLTQIKRNGKVALYGRSRHKKQEGYELFVIKMRRKGDPLPGGAVEPDDREVYPSANQFGISAWSIGSLKAAEKRFDELTTSKTAEAEELAHPEVVEEKKNVVWPGGKFSTKELAESLAVTYTDAYMMIKTALKEGLLILAGTERRAEKGKETKVFTLKASNG